VPVHSRFGRYALEVILVFWLLAGRAAFAQSCSIHDPRYRLTGDTVVWTMRIASGHSCVRGVRFGAVRLERVNLVSPPQSGRIALEGPGFRYTAKIDFSGLDSFTVRVFGAIGNTRGSSTVRVVVSVAEPHRKPAAPGSVHFPSAPAEAPQAPGQPESDNRRPLPAGATLPPCPVWDWSKGSPPPMHSPFDRSKLYCPPPPFKPPHPSVGCTCPEQ